MFDHTLSCRPERAEPPKNGCCYSFARSGIKTFSYSTRVSPLITVKSHCLFLFLARLFPPCLLFLPIMRWSIPWQNIESFQYTHQVTNQPTNQPPDLLVVCLSFFPPQSWGIWSTDRPTEPGERNETNALFRMSSRVSRFDGSGRTSSICVLSVQGEKKPKLTHFFTLPPTPGEITLFSPKIK